VFELLRESYFADMPQQHWEDKIEQALHAVALNPADVLGKYPHQLSGGQQQRVLIARALLLDVKLLIADEIISMLDASTRVDVLNLLVSLKRSGLAILFITHDLSLGKYISDRTVILQRGAVVEMGPTAAVFGNPQHPYTKLLMTAVPQLHHKWQAAHGDLQFAPVGAGASGATRRPLAVAQRELLGRPAARRMTPAELDRALTPPALLECEPGHLVADDGRIVSH
jgi:ABC-type oligopeptide transport system ATPase subunit